MSRATNRLLLQTLFCLVCFTFSFDLRAADTTAQPLVRSPLLVVGFMGGRVRADNMAHKEAVVGRELSQKNPGTVNVLIFANHTGDQPLQAVLKTLDRNGDGKLSADERAAARIVIYGHSWGASETVNLARQLQQQHIPVLLTIQVDSVQKPGENDETIPANVRQAFNVYQTEGILRGRARIRAENPAQTTILANRQISYRNAPVACDQFPWYARTFMRPHIEIENDPHLWKEIEAMIQAEI